MGSDHKEEAEFFKFFDQYEADLWHELNQSAEAQGNDPLELLNSWSDDQGIRSPARRA